MRAGTLQFAPPVLSLLTVECGPCICSLICQMGRSMVCWVAIEEKQRDVWISDFRSCAGTQRFIYPSGIFLNVIPTEIPRTQSLPTPSEPKFRRVECGPFIPRQDCLPNGVSFFDLIFPCESPEFPGTPFTRELYFIPGPRRLRRQRQAPPSAPRGP